jgi:uncharacterized phiE125 gp8 family phage protein
MHTHITIARTASLFSLQLIKCHLRIHHSDHDELLTYLTTVATDWVEETLGKSLLKETRQVTHNNNCFCLPYGPVTKVLNVKYSNKVLDPDQYSVVSKGDTLEVSVPFRWKSPEIVITYESGYGENPEDVPSVVRHAVLGTIEYLYENKGDIRALNHQTAPWLNALRSYRIV